MVSEDPPQIMYQKWWNVALGVVLLGWGGNQFLPLMQLYRQFYGFAQVQVDVLLVTYVLGLVPGFALAGKWSNRYGRKPVLVAGVLLGVVGSVVLACSGSNLMGLYAGRLVSGVSVATGMVVGATWIKELSVREGKAERGARRASAVLTLGFAGGAAVGGALAQWAPWPFVLPYVVHVAASLVALFVLFPAQETRVSKAHGTIHFGSFRIPRRVRGQMARVVLPLAPWVFAAPAMAFAVGPSLVGYTIRGYEVGFATLVALSALASGWVTQLFSREIVGMLGRYAGSVGVLLIATGALLLIPAASSGALWSVVVAAPVFGSGYGLTMVFGLAAVQAMASADELAGLTAVYYSITYVGFLLPAALAALVALSPMWMLLIATAVGCVACALIAARGVRRYPDLLGKM